MKRFSEILCLDENTVVETVNGDFPIKAITPGIEVLSYDENLDKQSFDIVKATAKSLHSVCAVISFQDGTTMRLTLDHPLFVVDKGWCAVKTDGLEKMYGVHVNVLEVGDCCFRFNELESVPSKVTSVVIEPCSEFFYCLQTESYHNFFANGILAHDVDIESFSKEQIDIEGVIVER